MNGTYNLWLVALSFAVASIASYVALDLASHVTASSGRSARSWLVGGALSMGLGIWSMHFIGMLAFRLPMSMSYSVSITGASLLVAILVSGFALRTVSGETLDLRQLSVGAVLMGVGIASMHYVGMAAMQIAPPIRYDPLLFGLSIMVAIVVSLVALWIAFRLRQETILSAFWRKGGSALVMGAAICSMHYTGMAAANFSASSMPTADAPGIGSTPMAMTIASFTFLLLGTTLVVSMFDARRQRERVEHQRNAGALRASNDELEARVQQRTAELANINAALQGEIAERERTECALRASEQGAREIVDTAYDAYVGMSADGRIMEWNRQAERTFGWAREEVIGQSVAEIIIPPRHRSAHAHGIAHFHATGEGPVLNKRIEITALHRGGHEFPVELTIWPVKAGATHTFNAFLHDVSDRQKAARRLAAQAAAAAALVESSTLDEAARKVLQAVCDALGWAVGTLWLADRADSRLHCEHVWHQKALPAAVFAQASRNIAFSPGVGLPGRVWQDARPLWIADVSSDSNFPRAKQAADGGLHAAFGFPIVTGGTVLGVVEFFSSQIQEPDDALLQMMDMIGALLGQFIENRKAETALETIHRGLTENQQRLEEAQKIARIGSWEWDVAADKVVWSDEMHRIYGTSPETVDVSYEAFLERVHPEDRATAEAAVGTAMQTCEPFEFEHRIVRPDGTIRTLQAKGQIIVDDAGSVVRMLGTGQDVTELKQTQQRLLQLAHFDPLTALPNRAWFYESLRDALAKAAEQQWIVAVLFLDIDHFKNVNDTMGHACGDELLRQVGRRLVHTLRVRDTVGRLGGDEFAVILMSPDDPQSAAIAADRLHQALREPFNLEGREVTVNASIGITVFPADATDADVLMKYADTAMYAAKEAGRDTYRFYTASMNESAVRRLDLDYALRKALQHNEFVLYYQPKISLANGRWAGVEALLRWNRPGHGLVPPADFIPLLEETGLIRPVGIWVINTACRQIAAWHAAGIGPVPVAVNVSVTQLLHGRKDQGGDSLIESPELELAVESALREYGIAADLLELEMTESALMSHAAKTLALLQRLRSLGIQISIDDFGTGYSSLAYLKRFKINTIKIDQTFVRDITTDPDDAAITVAIIGLAHSLKLDVVAEGVETRDQLDFLRTHGCDKGQGYLMARPMPADAIAALFGASRSWLGDVGAAV